jgi:hypothetical protein
VSATKAETKPVVTKPKNSKPKVSRTKTEEVQDNQVDVAPSEHLAPEVHTVEHGVEEATGPDPTTPLVASNEVSDDVWLIVHSAIYLFLAILWIVKVCASLKVESLKVPWDYCFQSRLPFFQLVIEHAVYIGW